MAENMIRLLVIDDEIRIAKGIRSLAPSDFDVRIAKSIDEAFGHSTGDGWKPHAVLSDYMMPGTRGIDVLKKFRRKLPHVALFLMTATPSFIPQADTTIPRHIFTKPTSGREMFELIRMSLDQQLNAKLIM